jgi:hypothetical protein
MALPTVDQFRKRHPQYTNAAPLLIEQAIEAAKLFCDEGAFGVHYDRAVELKAAALLEAHKFGQSGPKDKGTPTYQEQFDEICQLVPRRMMVL